MNLLTLTQSMLQKIVFTFGIYYGLYTSYNKIDDNWNYIKGIQGR